MLPCGMPLSSEIAFHDRPALRRRSFIHARISSSRSEEHTSELQSLMRISYAVFCLVLYVLPPCCRSRRSSDLPVCSTARHAAPAPRSRLVFQASAGSYRPFSRYSDRCPDRCRSPRVRCCPAGCRFLQRSLSMTDRRSGGARSSTRASLLRRSACPLGCSLSLSFHSTIRRRSTARVMRSMVASPAGVLSGCSAYHLWPFLGYLRTRGRKRASI